MMYELYIICFIKLIRVKIFEINQWNLFLLNIAYVVEIPWYLNACVASKIKMGQRESNG